MKRNTPPYLSYTTFQNFLESLRATAVPTRINRGIMASMSGSNQALLLATIRFFGLASEQGIPTADLKRLIESKEPERRHVWRSIVTSAYGATFGSKIDLERTTTDELADAIRRQGVASPDRIRKCVTFFTLAAKDAGIKLSPHIKPYAGRRQANRRARAAVEEQQKKALLLSSDASDLSNSSEWQMLLSKFPDFDPSWPEDLRKNWFEMFQKIRKGDTTSVEEVS
jgi:uncharacterized protein DUF5343